MVGVGQERINPVFKLLFLKVQFWALYYTFFQVNPELGVSSKKIIPTNTNKSVEK